MSRDVLAIKNLNDAFTLHGEGCPLSSVTEFVFEHKCHRPRGKLNLYLVTDARHFADVKNLVSGLQFNSPIKGLDAAKRTRSLTRLCRSVPLLERCQERLKSGHFAFVSISLLALELAQALLV